jgi:hypothetical protein
MHFRCVIRSETAQAGSQPMACADQPAMVSRVNPWCRHRKSLPRLEVRQARGQCCRLWQATLWDYPISSQELQGCFVVEGYCNTAE